MIIKAKKSLGQNWLNSPSIVSTLISAATVKVGDTVLEVGPGQGVLTAGLLKAGAKVVAVEKDGRLIEHLHQTFKEALAAKQLLIIQADILDLTPADLHLKPAEYKLVANIPYYITGHLIRNFLETTIQPTTMVLMIQKEVAERIVGPPRRGGVNKESVLSISVKAYGQPRYVKTVPKTYFTPVPKVDSAILAIENIGRDKFKEVTEAKFFEVLRRGFSQKRKMLKNNLVVSEAMLQACLIPGTARAEQVSLAQWLALTKLLLGRPED